MTKQMSQHDLKRFIGHLLQVDEETALYDAVHEALDQLKDVPRRGIERVIFINECKELSK